MKEVKELNEVKEIDFPLPHPALPNADWVDCYRVTPTRQFATAREAAEAVVEAFPGWMKPMLGLRSILVKPLGLKHVGDQKDGTATIGFFPVLSETPNQLIAGLDDKHLNFCLVVDLQELVVDLQENVDRQSVSLATLIKRHNFSGRVYLQAVLPFHRAIIKAALSRL